MNNYDKMVDKKFILLMYYFMLKIVYMYSM